MVASLDAVPGDAAAGVHRLIALGVLRPGAAPAVPPQATGGERQVFPLPDAVALCEARESYHLGRLAATVRSLVHGGWGHHRVTRDAVAFLIAHQDTDGAFGYPAFDDLAARTRARYSWTRSAAVALTAAEGTRSAG
ncbi:hypothetical protein AB0J25_27000 [Streptomyces sp. NPDC049910]|uniref:hypothetical protein n=1 Tax=Streptomyces sp. NPDC049910 TaxID=3155278 RepID=UPI003415E117